MSAVSKLTGITDGSNKRSGNHRADATQLLQADGRWLTCRDRRYLTIEFAHVLIKCAQVIPQAIQQMTKVCRQTVIGIF
ncbi:hypothetical protein D3C76_1292840 [compost metagenome]